MSAFEGSPVMYNIADLKPLQGNSAVNEVIEITDSESDVPSETEMDLHFGDRSSPKEPKSPDPEVIWELKERPDHPSWMGSPVNPPMFEFKPPNGEVIIITDNDESD